MSKPGLIDPSTPVPTVFERYRKFVVAAATTVASVAVVVGDLAAGGDVSTVGGVVALLIQAVGALGVKQVPNAR